MCDCRTAVEATLLRKLFGVRKKERDGAEIARCLELPLSTVSAWFREYRKPRPAKQPTAEQALGIKEFLEEQDQK